MSTTRVQWTPRGHFAPEHFPAPPTSCIDESGGDCNGPMGRRGYCRRHAKRAYRRGLLKPLTLEERFWSKVRVDDATGCWEWIGGRHPGGYGRFAIDGRNLPAHRIAYTWLVASIPAELHVDHLCRNPPCVNPAHLEPVTPRENVMRGIKGEVQRTGKCGQGHAIEADRANCRKCDAARATARRKRLGIVQGRGPRLIPTLSHFAVGGTDSPDVAAALLRDSSVDVGARRPRVTQLRTLRSGQVEEVPSGLSHRGSYGGVIFE